MLISVLLAVSQTQGGSSPTEPTLSTTELIEPTLSTTEPSTRLSEFTFQLARSTRSTSDSPTISTMPPPLSPGDVIYAASGFAVVICILLIVVIIVVVICIVQRRKHRTYQYGNGFKFGSPTIVSGAEVKNEDVAVTVFSSRMHQFVDSNPDKDIITIENTLAEPLESLMHHYDLPSEPISADNIHYLPWTDRQTAASVSGSISQISKTYDSASELETTHLLRCHSQTVKNPLYQKRPQEPTSYDPEELHNHKLGTPGITYGKAGTDGSPGMPPIPLSLDDSHYSPPLNEFDNVTAFHLYDDISVGSLEKQSDVFVPSEIRQQMTRKSKNFGSSQCENFEEKQQKLSVKKKKFFKEQIWRPTFYEEEDDQLSRKCNRKLLGQNKHSIDLNMAKNTCAYNCDQFSTDSNRAYGVMNHTSVGADMSVLEKSSHKALFIATKSGNIERVRQLITSGINMNIQNSRGRTILMVACDEGYSDIIWMLVILKADVNIQDKDGWTALMLACQHGDAETAYYLIEYGADVNLMKNDGWTALTLARENHHTDTVKLLTECDAVDAVPKKHVDTSTYSTTGPGDSGYGPSADNTKKVCTSYLNSDVTSIVVSVTAREQYFTWEGYGLHLYIPEDALPPQIEACNISIEVSTYMKGSYILSENSYLVSAVYWFSCVPKCKFSNPITLEIQHCAKQQNLQALSFVKSRSRSEIKFNKALGCCSTNHGVFPKHSSYGFIQLDSFCGYGVVQEGSEDRQYRANLYYLPQSISLCQIHFTVLWNTDAHHSVIRRHYLQQNAEIGPDKSVEFDSESVRLDIPKEGIATNDKMWTIFPLTYPPEVTKKEVDSFDEGKRIPACQLQARVQIPQHYEVTDLIHPLKLLGTKTVRDYIILFRSPINTKVKECTSDKSPEYQPLQSDLIQHSPGAAARAAFDSKIPPNHDVDPLQTQPLQEMITTTFQHSLTTSQAQAYPEPPRLTTLLNELMNRVAAKWEEIGFSLQIESGLLEIIKKDNPNDCRACLKEMLKEWMKQVDPPPSWSAIIKAVKDCGNRPLARILRSKYLPGTSNATLS